ncbi:RagB/SusD family nutrient uptake outer membrane protein [Puia sp. P3]|uniref:RagB/SusD family nutrient uptake outer membrane protein n=1 Tax=Puia sp. P3 TaxID=3423952 RepID=UPI003D675874
MFNISKSCWAIFLASILVILFSCEKLVSVQPPISQITNANVLTSDESANAVILGMYAKIINGTSFDFLPTLLPALTADELKSYSTNTAYISYATNNISSADTYIENIWSFSYNVIYQANAFLENIEQAQAVSSGAKAQYSGEALFMRAFMYFNLVNLFGRVPLINFF